jgi:16S rRNA (uracil1498-N3)-methyltransferase
VSLTPFVHVDPSLHDRRAGEALVLDDGDRHHLTAVLRLPPGARVEVSDGAGGHAPAVLGEDGEVVLAADATVAPAPRPRLRVVQALPKGRKMDDVVRICVELGVDEVVPVAADRSVTRLDGARAAKAVGRWRAVARAASEQARRRHRPEVADIVTSDELRPDAAWLLALPSASVGLPAVLAELADAPRITVAVGPEGGWSPEEEQRLLGLGGRGAHLGRNVLRTEHAAAAALAVLAAGTGRWG